MAGDRRSAVSRDATSLFEVAVCADRIITSRPDIDVDAFVAGFVAAEGCFTGSSTASKRK